jgi:hypothetical protein
MTGKTVQFRAKPATAEEWIGQGAAVEAKPAPAPSGPMKRFTIDVPLDLHARIKVTCAERGKVMADEIRRLLEAEFPERKS